MGYFCILIVTLEVLGQLVIIFPFNVIPSYFICFYWVLCSSFLFCCLSIFIFMLLFFTHLFLYSDLYFYIYAFVSFIVLKFQFRISLVMQLYPFVFLFKSTLNLHLLYDMCYINKLDLIIFWFWQTKQAIWRHQVGRFSLFNDILWTKRWLKERNWQHCVIHLSISRCWWERSYTFPHVLHWIHILVLGKGKYCSWILILLWIL